MEPSFASYLNNEFLSADVDAKETHFIDTKEIHNVFLARNKRKYASDDEYTSTCKSMKGVRVVNGLEYKITCNTSKVSYVLDTEDFLFRRNKKKQRIGAGSNFGDYDMASHIHCDKRAIRFHRWVEDS